MRSLAPAAALLSACSTTPTGVPDVPVAGATPGFTCRSDALAQFAGQPATGDISARILAVSGARTIRWVQPGMMVTMDYREDRVTAWQTSENRIERVSCG